MCAICVFDMNFIQIMVFLSIAEEQSFSATAEVLNLSQSSVSKHLKSLEEELGLTLINRSSKKCELSEMGAVIFPEMQQMLKTYQNVLALKNNYRSLKSGTIELTTATDVSSYGLIRKIALFEKENPQYHIRATEMDSESLMASMIQKKHTLSVIRKENINTDLVDFRTIYDDEYVCVLSRQNRLALRPFMQISDLKAENLIVYSGSQADVKRIKDICSAAGSFANITLLTRNLKTLRDALSENMGVCLLYKGLLSETESSNICAKPLVPQVKSSVIVSWPKGKKLLAGEEALIKCLSSKPRDF